MPPLYLFIIIAGVFLLILSVSLGISAMLGRRQKAEILLIAGQLGDNVSYNSEGFFSNPTIQFEHDGTVFTIKTRRYKYSVDLFVSFDLLPIQEKFFIRHNSPAASLNVWSEGNQHPSPDCRPVSIPALSESYILHSLNADFLLSILADEKVVSELTGYQSDSGQYVEIAFETHHFELTLHTGNANAEKFRQICETAIVFHDRIKAL